MKNNISSLISASFDKQFKTAFNLHKGSGTLVNNLNSECHNGFILGFVSAFCISTFNDPYTGYNYLVPRARKLSKLLIENADVRKQN